MTVLSKIKNRDLVTFNQRLSLAGCSREVIRRVNNASDNKRAEAMIKGLRDYELSLLVHGLYRTAEDARSELMRWDISEGVTKIHGDCEWVDPFFDRPPPFEDGDAGIAVGVSRTLQTLWDTYKIAWLWIVDQLGDGRHYYGPKSASDLRLAYDSTVTGACFTFKPRKAHWMRIKFDGKHQIRNEHLALGTDVLLMLGQHPEYLAVLADQKIAIRLHGLEYRRDRPDGGKWRGRFDSEIVFSVSRHEHDGSLHPKIHTYPDHQLSMRGPLVFRQMYHPIYV